jgi:hypothetical protein
MSLPPVNATTVALNNSAPGTTELFGKMLLGVGVGVATIFAGAVIYSKLNPSENNVERAPAKGGSRRTHRARRNGTRKA